MSLREWLIAIGALILIVVVVDGIRRMRRARKDSIAISSGMGADEIESSPLDDEFNPELPNGGARSISRDTLEERGYFKVSPDSRQPKGAPARKPTRPVVEQRPSDSADTDNALETNPATQTGADAEPDDYFGSADDPFQESGVESFTVSDEPASDGKASTTNVEEDVPGDTRPAAGGARQPEAKAPAKSWRKPRPEPEPPTVTSEVEDDTARRAQAAARKPDQPLAGANRPIAEEVVVINVLAKEQGDYSGKALKSLFEACGLEYGDLDIYHRHETTETISPVQFSVANAVEPGTFKPAAMVTMSTPGISFFMSLPGPSNAMQAFDFMLETAQCVVKNLGGELKDERRSVMTAQTIEHCRQRIREYERKRHSRR
ncbi:cell division protein ZipA [uncultured Marinobacter sp.]|uniref:cell division protein ZipA n=1 Tax=uncultured Marinobacter sp. TaxID=187379 RepID=UPI0030DD9160